MPSRSVPLAAIDIGSNSFRLQIAQLTPQGHRVIVDLKESVRLGAGLDDEQQLSDAAMARGSAALRRFAERLRGFAPRQVRAVATQTLRESSNRDVFLRLAESALGFPVEVISGREEARLIYAGVALLQPSATPRLVIDIGGRSTEMILGLDDTPTAAESFKVGSVSLGLRFFGDGRFGAEAFREAQIAAGAALEEALQPFGPSHWREALGSSGTTGAVAEVLAALGVSDGRITPEALRWCIRQCIAAGHVDQLDWPGLDVERKALLGGGLALLYTLVTQFQIAELRAAQGALRHGVIVDLSERIAAGARRGGDPRALAVRELQSRFDIDADQARRVRQIATAWFRAVCPQADAEAVRELQWACDLHEAGLMVSHHDHHRHGAYLVEQVDAPGFSLSQQQRIAALVLGQRGSLRKLARALQDDGFGWQLMCLRLACIVCQARDDDAVPARALGLQREDRAGVLRVAARWSARHPSTVHSLREEAGAWARQPGGLTLRLQAT